MSGRGHWVVLALAAIAIGYGVFGMGSGGGARVQFGDRSTARGEDIATPLVGSVGVHKRRGRVTLYLALQDADGKRIRAVRLPNGRRPAAPRVEIFDADGQRVYACTLRYG